jgi:hypothetical protein
MAENLKNTLLIDGEEYNINAVEAKVAKRVDQQLTIKKSLTGNSMTTNAYDGSAPQTIEYVPATGGKYKGPVLLDTNTTD